MTLSQTPQEVGGIKGKEGEGVSEGGAWSDMGWELSLPNMSLSPPPIVKHTGQESGVELCEIFNFFIVSVVKTYKQCLQTASASGERTQNR